jgi:hypothetical protein
LALPASTDSQTGQAIVVDRDHPRAAGTLNAAGLNWNNGIGVQPDFRPASDGPEAGTARVGIALLTKRDQPPGDALGVVVNLNVVRGRCLGAVGAVTEEALTIGGAAEFAAPSILKPTVFGQPINDGPGADESVFKAGRIVPVKAQIVAADGALVSDEVGLALAASCAVTLTVTTAEGTVGQINEAPPPSETSTVGSCLRYDPDADHFIIGWSTKGLPSARYTLRVTVGEDSGASASRGVTVALR